jgi:hypothetical protein
MPTQKVIVWIPWGDICSNDTQVGGPEWKKGPGNPEWWEHRVKVFERFTVPSLLNQSCKDFLVWVGIAQESKEFSGPLEDLLRKLGPPFEPFFHVARETLGKAQCPPDSMVWKALEMADCVGTVWLDSDDMYHREALEILCNMKVEEGLTAGFRMGYGWNVNTGEVQEYNPRLCPPPFFIRWYTHEARRSVKEYETKWGYHQHHFRLTKAPKFKKLPDGKFCVVYHGFQLVGTWDLMLPLKMTGPVEPGILKDFGVTNYECHIGTMDKVRPPISGRVRIPEGAGDGGYRDGERVQGTGETGEGGGVRAGE